MKTFFTAVLFGFVSLHVDAQMNYNDSNHIGISVGLNQTTLDSDNFSTTPAKGWNAGLSVRGKFYNNFDMVYAMQFSENNFDVKTLNMLATTQEVSYKMQSAQISLMLSYKIANDHLSVEVGPVLQVNGKLKIDDQYNNNIIAGTMVRAADIVDVNTFNFLAAAGVTAGFTHFRINAQYMYGVNNSLAKLNDKGLGANFKGHLGIVTASIIVYL